MLASVRRLDTPELARTHGHASGSNSLPVNVPPQGRRSSSDTAKLRKLVVAMAGYDLFLEGGSTHERQSLAGKVPILHES